MLQRHVDVFHQRSVFGDGVQQLLRDPVRIAIEKPDPFLALGLNLRQPRHQLRQAVLDPKIFAVRSGVLADQIDLADSAREQPRGFRRSPIQTAGCETCRDTAG